MRNQLQTYHFKLKKEEKKTQRYNSRLKSKIGNRYVSYIIMNEEKN